MSDKEKKPESSPSPSNKMNDDAFRKALKSMNKKDNE
jgi:hypothetical protein